MTASPLPAPCTIEAPPDAEGRLRAGRVLRDPGGPVSQPRYCQWCGHIFHAGVRRKFCRESCGKAFHHAKRPKKGRR